MSFSTLIISELCEFERKEHHTFTNADIKVPMSKLHNNNKVMDVFGITVEHLEDSPESGIILCMCSTMNTQIKFKSVHQPSSYEGQRSYNYV